MGCLLPSDYKSLGLSEPSREGMQEPLRLPAKLKLCSCLALLKWQCVKSYNKMVSRQVISNPWFPTLQLDGLHFLSVFHLLTRIAKHFQLFSSISVAADSLTEILLGGVCLRGRNGGVSSSRLLLIKDSPLQFQVHPGLSYFMWAVWTLKSPEEVFNL